MISLYDICIPPIVPPPRELPPVILAMKETYRFWLTLYRDFPKVERFGIGNKIEQSFLECLELTFCLSYLSLEQKIPFLNKAITRLDVVKFFTQLCWEQKLISHEQYADLLQRLEEIGRQLGGWKRGLQTKTLTQTSERK